VLAVLCSGNGKAEARELALRGLADYHWREPIHRAVFEIVTSFPSLTSRTLREQLPARLTRQGFPDFDFESLFDSQPLTPAELEQSIRKLLATA